MRFVFWLLLILNVGVLAYFNLNLIAPSPATKAKPDLNPEKIQLLTQEALTAMPKRNTALASDSSLPVSNEPASCYEWGSFTSDKLTEVQNILAALNVKNKVVQEGNQQSVRYWVYKPPLPNAEATRAKVAELRALGIEDFFVVLEPKMRHAISFGIFKDERLANKLADDLRHKGVREVVVEARNQGGESAFLVLEGVTATLLQQLKKNQPDFPLTDIKEVACPVS
ncbi:MAG TPA: sporulation protein [Methylophilaceae bacterium]|nr:sporulation protein [Methylophilaceae bacterium]HAJ71842.1 sporulation protein [Methylophilaceae bacterium]